MQKYWKQFVIVIAQVLMFYLFPVLAKHMGAMGMVLVIVLATFVLSALIGSLFSGKFKYLYPIFVAMLFIPSAFIYYNESALIQAVWYLVISFIGLSIGLLIRRL